eukprot:s569_g12.t1
MRSILEERSASFSSFVNADTGPVPVAGAAPLPTSLLSLASRLEEFEVKPDAYTTRNLMASFTADTASLVAPYIFNRFACLWQDDVFAGMDAGQVMILTQFDFLRRAVEALAVGASLALQAAALAAIAEVNCMMKFSPRTAAVSAVDSVQDAANGLLALEGLTVAHGWGSLGIFTKLVEVLPPPSGLSASTPLRRCLSDRLQDECLCTAPSSVLLAASGVSAFHLQDAKDRLPQASVPLVASTRPLLSLDFCGRLFNATAHEVLSAAPYAGDAAFKSATEFFAVNGEQRHVRPDASSACTQYMLKLVYGVAKAGDTLRQSDTSKSLAFVGPFANYATRTGTATSAFTSGDQVIQLHAVQEMTLRRAAPEVEESLNLCTTEQLVQLASLSLEACPSATCDETCQIGCYRRPDGISKTEEADGSRTSDAEDEDVESMPSHLSQIEGDEDDVPDTDPATYTLKDVKVEELDMSDCVQKILEGLRGDAFCIARDIGLERLLQYDGIDHLVEEIRKQAFPLQSEEASELSRQGQLITGPLAKQPGEPMLSYIARRKRWWSTLRELDPDIRLSEAMRELSGLDRTEQLMIKTAARTHSIDEYAKVLVQHHSVMHMKERLLTSKDMSGPGRPWKRFPPQDRYPKFGYLGYDPESQDGEHPEGEGQPGDGYGYEGYPATAPGGASDDDWVRTRTLQSRSTPIWRWHPKLRSYEDTEADDFWKVCNDISEEFYIDAFSRTCFIGDDQETDPEDGDEELVPDVEMPLHEDDAGGALTPGERERLILEQYPFPGTPATEAERRAAWRMLPQRVRVAIRRLHRAFGQVLKQARANKDFIAAARLCKCKVLSALYFITGEDNKLCAAICTHVDDFLWAATPSGEPIVQRLLDRFKIGRIESDTFRFCGREYVQSAEGTIKINCRDNTRAIRPIDIHKSEKGTTPVTNAQRTALRSVIGSLAWVARATRPNLAYRVNALQQAVVKATVETLREANRVVALALNDAERSITYKAKLPWSKGELAVVTFCDASFAGEQASCSFQRCIPASNGLWAANDVLQACDPVDGNGIFYSFGNPNSSCPFICEKADEHPLSRSCAPVSHGYFSPTCNNTWEACSGPEGVSDELFSAVANFTTAGHGAPDGCEITLAFPMAMPASIGNAAAAMAAPFTVELFVNISLDAIPVGSTSSSSMAVLVGSFPTWYLALRRSSSGQAQLLFYHSRITLASHLSAEDSVIASNPVNWDNSRQAWRHVAVVVIPNLASTHNVFFYVDPRHHCRCILSRTKPVRTHERVVVCVEPMAIEDGELASSGYRVVSLIDILEAPYIVPAHRDVFHVGPVNVKRFPELLAAGRPYYDLPLYTGQLDEVRVHHEALDGLTLGSQISELRRRAACNSPFEQLEGSTCQALPRLTAPNTSSERSECRTGYELCGALPGICVEACPGILLRQSDCSCDCPPAYFQTWLASAIHLTGSGEVRNATIYDAEHTILGSVGFVALPQRIALSPDPSEVAVVEVWGGASASYVSLEVETPSPSSQRLGVSSLHDVALQADQPTLLHHRRVLAHADPSLSCSRCSGEAPRSVLPRQDAMSCRCADGYGPNLLGKCVPVGGPLQSPVINLDNGTYHTAGTRVRLSFPPGQDLEAPWLLAIRYEYGSAPQAPSCETSLLYEDVTDSIIEHRAEMGNGHGSLQEPANVPEPGLDIIRRQESVIVRAVLCHPMWTMSLESRVELYGNDQMNPPRCVVVSGDLSTETSYALQVEVDLLLDQQPDATIFYEIQGSSGQATFVAPLVLNTPGVVTVTAWAEKLGFDPSTRTTCAYTIDGQARARLALQWPALADNPLEGFAAEQNAWLAPRGMEELSFDLDVSGVPVDTPGLQLQYRLERGALGFSSWTELPPSRGLLLRVADNLEAPNRTTLLQIEWRAKEPGYIWTTPGYLRVLFVATRVEAPIIQAEPVEAWSLGDSWFPGSSRERASSEYMQSNSNREFQSETGFYYEAKEPCVRSSSARMLFSVRAELGQLEDPTTTLLEITSQNVSSLSAAFVERFRSAAPSVGLSPEAFPSECSGVSLIQAAEVPKLCDYLGQFQVLGGAVVTAYAMVAGLLESLPATFLVPKEVEPAPGDLSFQAPAEATGQVLTVQDVDVKVMPSTAESLIVTVGQPSAERQSCVLATPYRYTNSAPVTGMNWTTKSILDCSWLPYNGPRKLNLDNMMQQAGLDTDADLTLNVTILTTVRRPGYLWSFPTASAFFWLRERTPAPQVVQVLEPGAANPAAMEQGGEAVNAKCYFTLHYEPLELSDVPAPFLVEVPTVTASVASFFDAFRPTTRAEGLHGSNDWRTNVDLCSWPSVCELPLNGTLPAELVYVPSGYSRLCAWARWPGYLESAPSCKLMGPLGTTQVVEAAFVPGTATSEQVASLDPDVTVPEQVGTDAVLRAQLLQIAAGTNNTSRRLSGLAEAFPLFLERSHPLQYRFGSVALDARDHILFVVDVRLLTGVNRWSAETRSVAILLVGQQPTLSISRSDGRQLRVQGQRENSTIYFKWLGGAASSTFGHELIHIKQGATTLADVFGVSSEAVLQQGVDNALCTVGVESPHEEQRKLCTWQGEGLEVEIPSSTGWTLWAVSSSPGLPSSMPAALSVGPQCGAPAGVAFAMAPSCSSGQMIESGQNCTTSCEQGYQPSVSTLRCSDGVLTPLQFVCLELSCESPFNVSFGAEPACLEGGSVSPGGRCTPACEGGYVPSEAVLSCARGDLSPGTFRCDEAACDAPSDVLYAASCLAESVCWFDPLVQHGGLVERDDVFLLSRPSCSGLVRVTSRSSCTPQCQDGYLPSETSLQCIRGQLSPATFACEPGVTVDMGIIIASVPSTMLAAALALLAGYCAWSGRIPPKTVELDSDPLQEWWTCVHEVEPGVCVFCGKQPEEVETRYEEHGPASLFRSCRACATLLGFEEEEEDEEEVPEDSDPSEAVPPPQVTVDTLPPENDVKSSSEAAAGPESSEPEEKTPPSLLAASPGSISDAVAGLKLDDLLKDQALDGLDGYEGRLSPTFESDLLNHSDAPQMSERHSDIELRDDASAPLRGDRLNTRRRGELEADARQETGTPRRSDFGRGQDFGRLSKREAESRNSLDRGSFEARDARDAGLPPTLPRPSQRRRDSSSRYTAEYRRATAEEEPSAVPDRRDERLEDWDATRQRSRRTRDNRRSLFTDPDVASSEQRWDKSVTRETHVDEDRRRAPRESTGHDVMRRPSLHRPDRQERTREARRSQARGGDRSQRSFYE